MLTACNVGSGQRPFASTPEVSWINVDKIAHEGMPEPDLFADGASLPLLDQSVDLVVLHHVLEHFGCGEGAGMIKEASRVLRPGGSLLVFVPDLHELAIGWITGRITTQIYVTNLMGAYMGHEEDRHKWNFDQGSLREFLSSCADWAAVKRFNWRWIPGADLSRDWWILDMECVK